jgi:hypothetical protein
MNFRENFVRFFLGVVSASLSYYKTENNKRFLYGVIKSHGGIFVNKQIVVSAKSLVERLFQFSSVDEYAHKQFIDQMIAGIIGSQSTLLSNIGRFLAEKCRLKHTVKRLGRMLNNVRIPIQELQVRMPGRGMDQITPH